jgi:hypothetical protein
MGDSREIGRYDEDLSVGLLGFRRAIMLTGQKQQLLEKSCRYFCNFTFTRGS